MVVEATQIVQCSNPHCRIAETGKCVEGLERSACGNFGKQLQEVEDPSPNVGATSEMVALPIADRLKVGEVRALLRRHSSRVIAIVGPHDAGKTSLIASLYDQFQQGPVGESHFRQSKTLHAFEQACHDARAASERGIPHSERTKRGEIGFYHLGVMSKRSGRAINLILGDRAGEEYRDAGDDLSVTADFVEVARADVVTVLVDGERLSDNAHRHNVRSDFLLILQALSESGVLPLRSRLAVVLTKLDVVRSSPNAGRAEADLAADLERVRKLFSTQFAAIEVFHVAASPKELDIARGTGVSDLLAYWLLDPMPAGAEGHLNIGHPRMIGRLLDLEAEA